MDTHIVITYCGFLTNYDTQNRTENITFDVFNRWMVYDMYNSDCGEKAQSIFKGSKELAECSWPCIQGSNNQSWDCEVRKLVRGFIFCN